MLRVVMHFLVGVALFASPVVATAQDSDAPVDPAPGINSSLVSALSFRNIGPALMSGRVLDIAVDPVEAFIQWRIRWR